jgi:hypothetical protein
MNHKDFATQIKLKNQIKIEKTKNSIKSVKTQRKNKSSRSKKLLRSPRLGFVSKKETADIGGRDIASKKLPFLGFKDSYISDLRKFSEAQLCYRRKILLRLTREAKNDFEKTLVISKALNGTLIRSTFMRSFSIPYVSFHPKGWLYVTSTPSLRSTRELLGQCLNSYCSILAKVGMIAKMFKSIDSQREKSLNVSFAMILYSEPFQDLRRMAGVVTTMPKHTRYGWETD